LNRAGATRLLTPAKKWSGVQQAWAAVLLVCAVAPRLAHAQPALVQSNWLQATQTNQATLALAAPPAPGNVLVAICATAVAQALTVVTPGWSVAIDQSANGPGQAILYKVARAADAAGLTIRYAASTRLGIQLFEYSGIDTLNPFHAVASSSGNSTSPTTGAVTTLLPNELLVAGFVALVDVLASGWTNGFVQRHNFLNVRQPAALAAYTGADRAAGTPGSYATSVTFGGQKVRWRGQVAAFNATPPVSVLVTNGTLAFGTEPPDVWLTPKSTLVINDGRVTENLLCRVSPFTDGVSTWAVSPSTNGPDQIQAQWSTAGATGPWTGLAAYNTDFTLATAVLARDTVRFWFRIRTPVTSTSFNTHSAGITITATAY
jgi:hypothetical protein